MPIAAITPIERLPGNFDEFVREVATELGRLYGPAAENDYRNRAAAQYASTLAHPAVSALAAHIGRTTAGLLFVVHRHPHAEISFLHVLRPFLGQGIEDRLLREAVPPLHKLGLEGIVKDSVDFTDLDLHATFCELGFTAAERQLMLAECQGLATAQSGAQTCPLDAIDWPEAAECIVDAYAGEPGRNLHPEVRGDHLALDFVTRAAAGHYGHAESDHLRKAVRGGEMAGTLLGCTLLPGVGFVLQVVVRPPYRRQGLATALLRDTARAFMAAGLNQIGLGVSLSNPARHLYNQLGFKPIKPIKAYAWWRQSGAA